MHCYLHQYDVLLARLYDLERGKLFVYTLDMSQACAHIHRLRSREAMSYTEVNLRAAACLPLIAGCMVLQIITT